MIKFFRHIRHSFIQQNKMAKYFKYAIGEIVLVVIGILIAIQLNQYYNNKTQETENLRYLQRIIDDLDSDITRLNGFMYDSLPSPVRANIKGLDAYINNCDSLIALSQIGFTRENVHKIPELLPRGGYLSQLSLQNATYEELLYTGKLFTFKNKTLLRKIQEHYKMCEREEFYNQKNNDNFFSRREAYYNTTLEPIETSVRLNAEFVIEDHPWLIDKTSNRYLKLQRLFLTLLDGFNSSFYRRNKILNKTRILKQEIEYYLIRNK